MKYLYCSFLAALISASCYSQVPSTCVPSPALKNLYANDVADIALERLYQLKSPDTALIEIPQAAQDTIMNAFAAVCNLGPQLQGDSIFRNYCVHRAPKHTWMPQSILVKVDTTYAWARQWFLGNTASGNTALEQFMSLHKVYLAGYFCEPWASEYLNNIATLTARSPINMKAFGDSLMKFRGVLYYSFPNTYGSGDRIYYTSDSLTHLTFIAGWGDCPSGCTSWKLWQYSISPVTCDVAADTIYFGGARERYSLANCNLQATQVLPPALTNDVRIRPNPASETLYISGTSSRQSTYRILDATGRTLLSAYVGDGSISISSLPIGFYTILVTNPEGEGIVRKFIRQ